MTNLSFSQELALTIYTSKETYPVDFEDAWQWLGYTRKDSAKEKLIRNFEEGLDYSAKWRSVAHGNGSTASRTEVIFLTVECFKSIGMMAGTSQGKAIRKYFLECEKVAKSVAEPKKAIHHYTDRVMKLDTHLSEVPPDYWVIMQHCGHILLKIEQMGYSVGAYDLVDSSIGKHWANYRRSLEMSESVVKVAKYKGVNQARFPVKPKAYPFDELGIFAKWLKDIYVVKHLPKYLEGTYKDIVKS